MSSSSEDEPSSGPSCGAAVNLDAFDSDGEETAPAKRVSGRADSSSSDSDSDGPPSFGRKARRTKSKARTANRASSSTGGRRIAKHTLKGTEYVDASSIESAAADAASNSFKTVEIEFYMEASLNQLQSGEVKPVLKLDENAKQVFDDDTEKRSKVHVCGGAEVVAYESSFPVTLQANVDGIVAGEPAIKSITDSGSRAAITIKPKSSFQDPAGIPLIADNEDVMNLAFMKKFAGRSLSEIKQGISYLFDKNGVEQAFIQEGHPVLDYYNDELIAAGQDPVGEANRVSPGVGLFMADADDTRSCMKKLEHGLDNVLQVQDLHNFGIKLTRARGKIEEGKDAPNWNDPTEILSGVDSARARQRGLQNVHQLYVTARIKYKTMKD